MIRVVNIVGTRPNLVKVAALLEAQQRRVGSIEPILVHTGQHSDPEMSERFFAELELPQADVVLDAGGGTQAEQIGRMLGELERVLLDLRPDLVVVVGDVNSTAAAALAASMRKIPVAHVEAGLRSFDETMPEELNRVVVDAVSDFLFASEESAVRNLEREGHPRASVFHVGNVMIDTLVRFRERSAQRRPAKRFGVEGPYAILTLHRPSNVDRAAALAPLLKVIGRIARRLPVIFPVHPRTRDRLDSSGLGAALAQVPSLHITPPLGYLDMLALLQGADFILTDSGGLQEESTYLGVPCLTLRDNTERPATVDEGTNRVVGTSAAGVEREIERVLAGDRPAARCPPLWDGRAAERVVDALLGLMESEGAAVAG